MLNLLRRAYYKMGFRPVLGTIMHSPSLHYRLDYEKAIAGISFGTLLGDTSKVSMLPTTPWAGSNVPPKPTLYERMEYCPVCGACLNEHVLDIKECPRSCGRALLGTNSQGLPIMTFEVDEES